MKLHFTLLSSITIMLIVGTMASNANDLNKNPYWDNIEVSSQDTLPPIQDRDGDFINNGSNNPFDLNDPGVIEQTVEYDPVTDTYIVYEKVGDDFFRAPTYLTFEEYLKYKEEQQKQAYFDQLLRGDTGFGGSGKKDPLAAIMADMEKKKKAEQSKEKDADGKIMDDIDIGPWGKISIEPKGNIDLTFGVDFQQVDNPGIPERLRRSGGFDFDMQIQASVTGNIGDRIKLGFNYNTQGGFDFQRKMKLGYTGTEDDIVQIIEAGDVSLPLRGTLIQGSQSLFGIKTALKFGRLTVTGIASRQRSQRKNIQIKGGSQVQEFEIPIDQYEADRHFFLSHFNRETYEEALSNLPQIASLFKITRMEVWVTNTRNQTTNVRDIVALADIGEGDENKIINDYPAFQALSTAPKSIENIPLPSNESNGMYETLINNGSTRQLDNVVNQLQSYGLRQARDFEKVRARLLTQSEYDFHPDLGYISFNTSIKPADVVGIAYEYTYNGQVYKVGEFTNDNPNNPDSLGVLYTKLLKGTNPRIDLPTWDLMMKNVYSLRAFQVDQKDFVLDVFYEDPGNGFLRTLPLPTETIDTDGQTYEGIPLIQLFNLDNLNPQGDPQRDGRFDFVPGITILPRSGKVIFPVLEPFGSSLSDKLTNDADRKKFVYQQLYDSTLVIAREYPELNRFVIKGNYRSSSSADISLGAFNVPRGSVVVRAGGKQLVEGVDFSVDYNLGRVRIINDAILSSGQPVNVSFEDNTTFGFQTKTMLGLRADYKFSEHLSMGGTVLKLFERPFTQKVNIGDDPINNTVYGLDVQYDKESPWLTRMVDRIPGIETKAPSNISFMAEVAYLKPGSSSAINQGGEPTVNIDDFEGSSNGLDLRQPATRWSIAATPRNDDLNNNPLFPEAELVNNTLLGVNRALLNWYNIDHFSIDDVDNNDNYQRVVFIKEVFPNIDQTQFQNNRINTLDLTYYPSKRGQYNFDLPNGGTPYSEGIDEDGNLINPKSRWGGIQRDISNYANFENANYEYIEFWMMSPFLESNTNEGGELYLNLGDVSEDVMRDSRNYFENGLPTDDNNVRTDTTSWGIIPRIQQIVKSFDSNEGNREKQDVGLDGADNEGEKEIFKEYYDIIQASGVNAGFKAEVEADVSNDDFLYYNDESLEGNSIFRRYQQFNNTEGNSRTNSNQTGSIASSTNIPDGEDINNDNSLNETEAYYQYRVPIYPDGTGGIAPNKFLVEQKEGDNNAIWYRFRVPIDQFTSRVGGIQGFRSIRFIRMYLNGFNEQTTMRFATLELIRNQWRRYNQELFADQIIEDTDISTFDVNAVNIEENNSKRPFNYVLPIGIEREQQLGGAQFGSVFQNEQSLAMTVRNLADGDAKAVFKNINFDMRYYKRMKMFVHAEEIDEEIEDGEIRLFVRMGSDFQNNYYEYEIPLKMSDVVAEGSTDPQSDDYRALVWLDSNEMDIPLELLTNIKQERNNSGADLSKVYRVYDPENNNNTVAIKGNPNLGYVKSIMVGVRNNNSLNKDYRSFEVWVNELRLSGFDEAGGAAATARLDMQLADFGNLSLSGNYSSIGWGALDQKLAERSREEIIQYDAATNLELGKFLPEKSGIKIPFYTQYSETIKTPQFDPYDLDLELKQKVDGTADAAAKDSIRSQAIDRTRIQSFNFTNVRKERTNREKTPMPWNIENFSFTYAYSKTDRSTPIIEDEEIKNYKAGIDYTYTRPVKFLYPFKKVIKKDKYLKFLTQFNLNPLPNSFSVSNAMDRRLSFVTYRFAGPNATYYNKFFNWDRDYNLKWDFTKALKFDFNARTNAVIDELDGDGGTDENRELVINNLKDFGRIKTYQHNFNVGFDVPLKNFPFLDFMQVKAQYNGTYNWSASALNVRDLGLGNVIQNSQNRQLTGNFDFEKLYSKWKYLDKIQGNKGRGRSSRSRRNVRKNDKVASLDEKRKGKDKKDGEPSLAEKILIRPLLTIRKLRVSYKEQFGTIVPGFTSDPQYLGMNTSWDAPGWDFVAGLQPTTDWLDEAASNELMSKSIMLNQQFTQTYSERLDAELTLEPFKDFKIDVEVSKNFSDTYTEYFKVNDQNNPDDFNHLARRNVGSYSISYLPINTLFGSTAKELFTQFEDNRLVVSKRIGVDGTTHETDAGYTDGFGRYQQDVLIPAFVSAYYGQDANSVDLDVFNQIPLPNWRLNYRGLTKLKPFKKWLTTFNLSHSYKSTLSVNSFNTDLDYDYDNPFAYNPNTSNYYSRLEIPGIVITEQLSPLLGIDVRTKNNISMRFDWKKARNLQMSFTDYQMSETRTEEMVFGFGYTLKNVDLFGRLNGGKKKKKGRKNKKNKKADPKDPKGKKKVGNDMDFRIDFSFRDDETVNYLLDQDSSIPTRGSTTIRFSPSVDYAINKQLSLRLFFDYNRTEPKTSQSFPITNTAGGVTLRFSLQ